MSADFQYEAETGTVRSVLSAVSDGLVSDLIDFAAGGGFNWWPSGDDPRRRALIADYTIQAVHGVSSAIELAALNAQEYEEQCYAADHFVVETLRNGQDILAELYTDRQSRRRQLRIQQALEACLFNMCRALDRMAAVVLVVGNMAGKKRLIRVDWGTLSDLLSGASNSLAATGTSGRDLQDALLRPIVDVGQFGPTDWLAWLQYSRNTLTHRSPATTFHLSRFDSSGRLAGFVRPLISQPDASEMLSIVQESLAAAAATPTPPASGVAATGSLMGRLNSNPRDVLLGLLDSTTKLILALSDAVVDARAKRLADPGILGLEPGLWELPPAIQRPLSFPGYGPGLQAQADTLAVNPNMQRRLEAASVMEGDSQVWA